ncbi:6904_t:CDS:2, partial [Funneliformis geosporum]
MNYESFTVIETENGKEKKQLKLWSTFFTDAEKDLLENNICQLETPGIDNGGFQLKALTEREIKEKFIKNIKDRFSGAFSSENDAILGENGKLNKLGNEELLGRRGSVLLCLARSIIGTVHAKVLDKTTEKTLKSELKEYLENYIANHTNGSETIIYNDTGDIYGNYAKMIKEIRKQALITKKQKKDLEEAVEYLVRLDQKGYSPTEDAKKLTFLRNEDTDNADFYSNNLEEKVQKLTTQLTDPTDQTHGKDLTAEETIRRFIKEKEKSDLNAALSTEIEEVIIREQVIHSPAPESAEYILHSDKEVEATRN